MAVLIPKVVHRIWFGPHEMRDELEQFGESWERHGYEVRLWTEANLPPLRNQAVYDGITEQNVNVGCGVPELGKWVQRADIASYELIWRYGGIYANTDMECLRSLDEILGGVRAFAGFEIDRYLSNALMGCTPRHAFFDAVIRELPNRYRTNPGAPMSEQTGPHLLTEVATRRTDLTMFDRKFFNPYWFEDMEREWDDHPDAYTSHHWGHTRGLA